MNDPSTIPTPMPQMSAEDEAALRRAVETLEFPSFLAKVSGLLGNQVERLQRTLPGPMQDLVNSAVEAALRKAANVAKAGLEKGDEKGAKWTAFDSKWGHRVEGVITGAAGGMLGVAGLAAELPVTTTLILRSILAVAKEQGEDLSRPETIDECLKVFAFGGGGKDKTIDSAYFAARAGLPRVAVQASELLPKIAARFAVPVSEKAVAQAAPIVGAVGGATVNLAFIAHFQGVAAAHFTVRRLERAYGAEVVRGRYLQIAAELKR